MRFLVAYNCWRQGLDAYYEKAWSFLRERGHDVRGFCLRNNPSDQARPFHALESAWRRGESRLLRHLERLETALADRDVLVNWNGSGLPPEFVRRLPQHTVYMCCDDPESSSELSRPAAWAYGQCLVQNAAAVDLYRDWGCHDAVFFPMGFMACDVLPGLTRGTLGLDRRDVGVVFLGERISPWRQVRLDRLAASLPEGVFAGRGWPRGYLPIEEKLRLYGRSKIGINLHNSTGPINWRLYQLPAHGVLQICDNRAHLGAVFEEGREIVGYDTVRECLELVHYYLHHEEERQAIALAGFDRAHKDYTFEAVWQRLEREVIRVAGSGRPLRINPSHAPIVATQSALTHRTRALDRSLAPVRLARRLVGVIPRLHTSTSTGGGRKELVDMSAPSIVLQTSVRIGILSDSARAYGPCRAACDAMDVPHRLIDLAADNWLAEVRRSRCDAFVLDVSDGPYAPRHAHLAERVRLMAAELGLPTRPTARELAAASPGFLAAEWLRVHAVPQPNTHIFLAAEEATNVLAQARYPLWAWGDGTPEQIHTQPEAERFLRRIAFSSTPPAGLMVLQETDLSARTFRVQQVGDSWLTETNNMPEAVLTGCRRISKVGGFHGVIYEGLVLDSGEPVIRDFRMAWHVSALPDGTGAATTSRWVYTDNQWRRESGAFGCRDGADLRIEELCGFVEHRFRMVPALCSSPEKSP